MRKLIALGCLLAAAVSLTAQSPLSTLFANNNGGSAGGAVYFDLTLNAPLAITQIDINGQYPTGVEMLDVYTVSGGYAGNSTNQAAWTGTSVLGSPVTLNPIDTPSPCVLNSPLILSPGTWGLALVAQGFGHKYTNGNGANQTYSTLEMTLSAGEATNVPFTGSPFSPRVANVNIHYMTGGGNFALATPFGTGCGTPANPPVESYYEYLASGPHDLAGLSILMIFTGDGYVVAPGGSALRGPGAGTALSLTDNSEAGRTFTNGLTSMPVPGGSTGELWVCSNGFVSVSSANQTGFSPSAAEILNEPATAWYTWTDLNPATSGSGQVYVEETATNVYVIYDGVYHRATTTPYYVEFHFDKVSGNVEMVFGPNGHTDDIGVGFSFGGPSSDPGATDLSDPLAYPILVGVPPEDLALAADARPVIGTSLNLVTSEVPFSAALGGQIFGLVGFNPGIDLTALGMPGCYQYVRMDAVGIGAPAGASSFSFPFTVPNDPALAGKRIFAQSAVFDPAGGHNLLGAIASNGVELLIDVN